MTRMPNGDDPELRALLDSIGLRPTSAPPSQERETLDRARAERDLDMIVSMPRAVARTWQVRAAVGAVAAAALGIVGYLVIPSSAPPAAAQTPPMLSFSVTPTTGGELSGNSAAATLDSIANAAAAQPMPANLPVQDIQQYAWWAVSNTGGETPAASVVVPRQRTTYLLPNGKMRDVEQQGRPVDQQGRVSNQKGSWQTTPSSSDETIDTGQPADYPATLPTDPSKLIAVLAPPKGCGKDPGDCLLNALANVYSTYVVTPTVSQALWRATALEPDVTTLGTTTDRLGRQAIGFAAPATSDGEQTIVLADPQTGAFLGSETILTKPNSDYSFTPPAVLAFTAVLSSSRVATAGP